MKNIRLFILLKLLITTVIILSVNNYAQVIKPQFISIPEGLSSANVQAVLQDSYGLMWVGTADGLHQYDGYKFVKFRNASGKPNSLLNNNVWGLVEDGKKNIWIAHDIGVSKYDRKTNEFVNYNFSELYSSNANEDFRVFDFYLDSKNRLWTATSSLGILLYDPIADKWSKVKLLLNEALIPEVSGLTFCLTEDSGGRIWSASGDQGIIYYNSADSVFVPAKIIQNKDNIDFTIVENQITQVYSDLKDVLWITARNGIYKFYPENGELKTIVDYNYRKLVVWNHWNNIIQDNLGNIWIGNNFRGILKFDGISDEYSEISFAGHTRMRDGSSDVIITRCIIDNTGIFWYGSTLFGLIKFDPSNEPFLHYTHDENNKSSITSNQTFGLLESKVHNRKIFVGTRGGGLNLFDQNNKTFSQIYYKPINDMFGGSVRSIAEESDGSLWLGTWGDGLIEMNSKYQIVNRYINDSLSFDNLSHNSIRIIKKDEKGNLWLGTNEGLNYLDLKTRKLKRIGQKIYPQELYNITSNLLKRKSSKASINEVGNDQDLTEQFEVIKPRNYLVISAGEGRASDSEMFDYGWIVNDNNDTIWTAKDAGKSFFCGGARKNRVFIDIVLLKPGKYKLRYISDDSHSYGDWNLPGPVYSNLWGIKVVELENESQIAEITEYLNRSKNEYLIEGDDIKSIQISKNIVWIGTTSGGLNKIDQEKNSVKTYSYDEYEENSISNNNVQFIHEDTDGILWLATDIGLNRFDPVKEEFKAYTEEDGLPTNLISSILPGDGNDLWISTSAGIAKMVSDNETGKVTFVNYDSEDGLGGMNFTSLIALKSSNGEYFFGGDHGLNAFTPGEANNAEPSLIFSDLKISNKSVKLFLPDETPLETSLIELKELELPHDENDLTFEFAALHYSAPNKNQYAHKLIGYDEEWIYDNKREATYTNLDHGKYEFSIKGSNRDGVWAVAPKTIKINITPPWWLTIWAYLGYGFLFVGVIFGVDRLQRRRLLTKAKERMKIQNAEHRAEAAELQAKASESERRALETEFEHKKKELDEARDLQLSMLPKVLPQLPQLDIAVYMKTATEVGGDYYDFHIGLDGALTCVLGDATGHGMKAGTMVTAVKGLFNSYCANPDILYSFQEISRCIKQMQLDKLSMCMTMLKINNNKMLMSAAGMPPILIYRKSEKSVSEHVIKGMPLGTFDNYPYDVRETTLNTGDTLLLMSDGFPELLNPGGELYGYQRVRNAFENSAEKEPEEIINYLKDEGSKWVHDNDPDDDVTFVVIKVK